MFVETVDKLLLEFQHRLDTKVAIPWGWFFAKLLNLLSRYPSGVTKAILLAELESSWKKIEKFHSKGTLHGVDSLRSISLTKQLSSHAVFEVFLEEVAFVEGTHTKIGVVRECDTQSRSGETCFKMEMYLHQKLYDQVDEIMAHNFKLRFTGCRLFESRSKKSIKLLPSENFVVLVDLHSAEKLFQHFSTLEGFDQYTESQYIKNIKVKVVEVGKAELIHYQNGQTVNKITVTVVDDVSIQAKFILWEEYLVMSNLFEEGDTLFIKDSFLVPDPTECYTLEYGPETVVFCLPVTHEQEVVPSQSDSSKLLYVCKDNKGKLDYSMYPERLRIHDVKLDMINMTLFGQVIHVGPKNLLKGDGVPKVEYHIKVQDESGMCTVLVTDWFKSGTVVYCGQYVLMKNLFASDDCGTEFELHLHHEKGGAFWNLSSLIGWLTTSSLRYITSLSSLDTSCHHCVVKGIISDLKAKDGKNTIIQMHCTCNTELMENMEGQPSCSKCNVSGMAEMPVKSAPKFFNLDKFWDWRYNLRMTVMESVEHVVQVNVTNEVAEKLIQLSPRQFQSLGEDAQRRVFECSLGLECYFAISNYNGELLVGAMTQI